MKNKKGKIAKTVMAAAVVAPAVAATPISFDGVQNTAEAASFHDHFQKHNNEKGHAYGHDKGNGHHKDKVHDHAQKRADKVEKKAEKVEKHLEKKADQIKKQLNKHGYKHFNRGFSFLHLAHKAVATGKPTPVHFQGEVVGYLVADVQEYPFGQAVHFKFVRDFPQTPVEDNEQQPVEETDPVKEEQPNEEVETPVEEEEPVEDTEQPVDEGILPDEEQPEEETEVPVEVPEEPVVEQPVEETPNEDNGEVPSDDELTEEEQEIIDDLRPDHGEEDQGTIEIVDDKENDDSVLFPIN